MRWPVIVCVVALAGCPARKEPTPAPDDAAAAPSSEVLERAPVPEPPPTKVPIVALSPTDTPVTAYVNVVGKGLHRIDRGRAYKVVPWAAQDIAVSPVDGKAYAVGTGGVIELTAKGKRVVSDQTATRAAVSPSGQLWIAGPGGLRAYDTAAGKFGEPKAIGAGPVRSIEFDAGGVLWVVTPDRLFQLPRADGVLVPTDAPVTTQRPQFKTAMRGGQQLYIAHGTGVLRVRRGSLETVAIPGNHFYTSRFALLGDGTIVAAGKRKAMLAHPAGRRGYIQMNKLKDAGQHILAVAGGPSARAWLATDRGLFAVTPLTADAPYDAVPKVERITRRALPGAPAALWVIPR